MTVWESIALHTTSQVPNYMQSEARLVALGVPYDVLGSAFDTLTTEQRDAVLAAHPRTKFKTGMIDALAAGVRDKPETAVGTMLTDILEATVPGYVRPSTLRRHPKLSLRDVTRTGLSRRDRPRSMAGPPATGAFA
jgi:hypothetical protein